MEEKLSEMLAFRVTPSEKTRAKQLAKEIRQRLPYATEAMVFRELFGFTDTGMISKEQRRSLREMVTESSSASAHSMASVEIVEEPSASNRKGGSRKG